MALTEAAFYDFFRKIVLQPDGITLEADHTKDELTITRGPGVAFNPTEGTDSFEIDVDYSLYVPVGSTSVTLRDVNAGESNISITAGSNIVVSRVSDNELEIIATVGGASKSISNISTTNPVVVTTTNSHSYTEGSEVTITDVIGMTEVNGNEYYMDILTGNTFALYSDPLLTTPVDGTAFTPYSTGGVATVDYTAVKTLSGLTDTTFTNPQNNDLITYNNGYWVNTNSITATLIGDVTGNLDGIVGGTTPAAGTFTELRTTETSIVLGANTGNSGQGTEVIAIGNYAGYQSQGDNAIAIGDSAGRTNQDVLGIAIGGSAGNSGQGNAAIAIGAQAGNSNQSGQNAIAIGTQAGWFGQSGDNSIAIGYRAGFGNQHTNSIIINASGAALNSAGTDRLYVAPIRQTDGPYYLKYEPTSGEISYASASEFVVGDLQGSVFADDSTTLVDAVNSKIVGDVENASVITNSLQLASTSPSFLITDTDGSGNGLTQTLGISKYLTSGYQIQALSNSGLPNLQLRVGNTFNLSMYETSATFSVPVTIGGGYSLRFEGVNNDSFETSLVADEPLQDSTVTIPNTTGTMALTSDIPATTDSLTEGSTNLYYTDARAQSATTGRAIAMSMIFGG